MRSSDEVFYYEIDGGGYCLCPEVFWEIEKESSSFGDDGSIESFCNPIRFVLIGRGFLVIDTVISQELFNSFINIFPPIVREEYFN